MLGLGAEDEVDEDPKKEPEKEEDPKEKPIELIEDYSAKQDNTDDYMTSAEIVELIQQYKSKQEQENIIKDFVKALGTANNVMTVLDDWTQRFPFLKNAGVYLNIIEAIRQYGQGEGDAVEVGSNLIGTLYLSHLVGTYFTIGAQAAWKYYMCSEKGLSRMVIHKRGNVLFWEMKANNNPYGFWGRYYKNKLYQSQKTLKMVKDRYDSVK